GPQHALIDLYSGMEQGRGDPDLGRLRVRVVGVSLPVASNVFVQRAPHLLMNGPNHAARAFDLVESAEDNGEHTVEGALEAPTRVAEGDRVVGDGLGDKRVGGLEQRRTATTEHHDAF